jgi:hypothetical protein
MATLALPLIRLSAPSPCKNGEKAARRRFRQSATLAISESPAASAFSPFLRGEGADRRMRGSANGHNFIFQAEVRTQ